MTATALRISRSREVGEAAALGEARRRRGEEHERAELLPALRRAADQVQHDRDADGEKADKREWREETHFVDPSAGCRGTVAGAVRAAAQMDPGLEEIEEDQFQRTGRGDAEDVDAQLAAVAFDLTRAWALNRLLEGIPRGRGRDRCRDLCRTPCRRRWRVWRRRSRSRRGRGGG